MIKSANHIFRTCQRATKVWNAVLGIDNYDPSDINFFFFWIDANLTSKESRRNMPWRTLFASTIWHIWKMRNEFQFNDKHKMNIMLAVPRFLAILVMID